MLWEKKEEEEQQEIDGRDSNVHWIFIAAVVGCS